MQKNGFHFESRILPFYTSAYALVQRRLLFAVKTDTGRLTQKLKMLWSKVKLSIISAYSKVPAV